MMLINPYRFAGYDSERSALLDGVDEYIDCGNDASLDFERTDSFSISFWVKITNLGGAQFLSKADNGASNRGYYMGISGADNSFQIFITSGSGNRIRVKTTSTYSTGTWYHLCFTYDGSSSGSGVNIYVDGSVPTLSIVNDTLSATISHSSSLKIGTLGTSSYTDGNLDEVSIWDKELDSSDVTEIYNSGCPDNLNAHSSNANLVSWWAIDSNDDMTHSTGSVEDKAGSNDGTPTNTEVGDLSTDIPC